MTNSFKYWTSLLTVLCTLVFSHSALALSVDSGRSKGTSNARGPSSSGGGSSNKHSFYVGLDIYSRSVMKTTSSPSAKKDFISPTQYPISFAYGYKLLGDAKFMPQLDYTLLAKKGKDGSTEETQLLLHLPYVKRFQGSSFDWKAGLVLHQTTIKGGGGTVTLNNGGGTASFAVPSDTRTSRISMLELGTIYTIQKFLIHGSLFIEGPFNKDKRNYSLMLGFLYNIGGLN